MNYSDLKLRSKTFLDFTTDEAVIEKIVGDKEFFIAHLTERNRAGTFLFFSDYTSDKKLAKAICKEFKAELECLFPE
ncbi:MAG: hypothetical protein RR279_01875 [Alistipes sp.]